ncbi:MAG TPA: AAA family ATPase [Solirubrobacteraceae bacterium]|nr:AAA family ATPase [Solirubrobacteraceae bacterium]
MYLKSITMRGFKSFPDRTRLEFGPGVSVIVGPNGSGKSNITDAVLWALGEQSPAAVRGQAMQDVIFGGAPGRQASAHAEVELVLDDSEASLGLGASEIAITRRLSRDGEGEYRMGGARCRLGDVIELLSDTGLGREMHSVISQGRVESLVTSRPRERRMLIEEAAGLGKHRRRRRRAQLRLERTQDNLDRALDVEREARSRLRPLERQARAAELHERLERQMLEVRWELARDQALERRRAIASAQEQADAARGRRRELEGRLESVGARRQQIEEALAARGERRDELARRAFSARACAERIALRAEAVRSATRSLQARIDRYGRLIEALEAQAAAEAPDADAPARIAGLQAQLDELDRDREAQLERELRDLRGALQAAAELLDERRAEAERARELREQADARLQQAIGAHREARRLADAARLEAARVGGELAAVNQFLRAHAGAPGGAPALGDELEVDPGMELAVAAALDGRLRAAIVPALAAGDELLDRAGGEGGRTLIATDAPVAPGAPGDRKVADDPDPPARAPAPDPARAAAPDPARAPAPGAVPLLRHVRGRGRSLALASLLLRDAWLVDDLRMVADDFAGVAVTAAGRVWYAAARELRQAPAHGEERVLAERNRRDVLIAASERAAQAELAARAALQGAAAEQERAEAARERAAEADRAAIRRLDEASEQRDRLEAQLRRRAAAPDDGPNAARRAQLTAELAAEQRLAESAERERAQRAERLERMRTALARDRRVAPELDRALEALTEAATAVQGARERFERELAADRQAGESVAEQLRACAREEAQLQAALGTEHEALTQAEVRLQRARDQGEESEAELRRLAAALELAAEPAEQPLEEQERAGLIQRLERLSRRREALGPVNPLAAQEYAEALAHVAQLEEQRSDLESALRELRRLIADTDRQIQETFERTFTATAKAFEEMVATLFPGGSGRLRLVSDDDGAARRSSVLGGEAASPAAGPQAAATPGAAPPGEGGDGDGDEDEAQDLPGVEIEIAPPGKAPRRLSLLSGGEKSMTALAFLFAVFLARPCPFYILDEVEAALDDLNIDRFLELLRRHSSRAQFIVVTHQKRTMEAADSLYGVSMGADGVSKVISRRLPPAAEAA